MKQQRETTICFLFVFNCSGSKHENALVVGIAAGKYFKGHSHTHIHTHKEPMHLLYSSLTRAYYWRSGSTCDSVSEEDRRWIVDKQSPCRHRKNMECFDTGLFRIQHTHTLRILHIPDSSPFASFGSNCAVYLCCIKRLNKNLKHSFHVHVQCAWAFDDRRLYLLCMCKLASAHTFSG